MVNINNLAPRGDFLNWLIGFAEGDGSFTTATRGDLYFFFFNYSGYKRYTGLRLDSKIIKYG